MQKCTTSIRILAYESSTDSVDDYVRIGETTTLLCLEKFVKCVYDVFGAEYLRRPNNNDIQYLLCLPICGINCLVTEAQVGQVTVDSWRLGCYAPK